MTPAPGSGSTIRGPPGCITQWRMSSTPGPVPASRRSTNPGALSRSAAFGLSDAQLRPSRETLRDYGNCSSVTVLLALRRLLAATGPNRPRPGDHAIMIVFGPGLTTEAALLRF